MVLEISGFLYAKPVVKEGVSAAGKSWKSIEFVIEMEASSQYPKKAVFSAFKDTVIERVLSLKVGDEIKVSFNVDAREHNGKWYNTISAWQVQSLNGANTTQNYTNDLPPLLTGVDVPLTTDDQELPF